MTRRCRSKVSRCSGPSWGTIHSPHAIGNLVTVRLDSPVVDNVRIEKIKKNGEEYWRVCGLGYCVEHRQRWQAEVTWECLRASKGQRSSRSLDSQSLALSSEYDI
jgi:hypothetical protein